MMDEQDFRLLISVMQLHCGKHNLPLRRNLFFTLKFNACEFFKAKSAGILSMWIISCLTDCSALIQRDLVLYSLTLAKQTRRMTQNAEILTQTS